MASASAQLLAAGSADRGTGTGVVQRKQLAAAPSATSAADEAATRLRQEAIREVIADAGDGGRSLLLQSAGDIGRTEYVTQLLAAGVPAACCDVNGCSPLHRAAFGGCKSTAEALIKADPQVVRAVDFMRNTPLHAAAFAGHEEIVMLLLKSGADVTAADAVGNQPVHRAVIENHPTVVARLLSGRASANAPGAERNTPLHMMVLVCLDDLRLAELLLAFQASPTVANRYGKSALALARYHGQAALVGRLQQHIEKPFESHLTEALRQPLVKGGTIGSAISPRGGSIVNIRGNSDLTLQEYPSSLSEAPGRRLSISAASPSLALATKADVGTSAAMGSGTATEEANASAAASSANGARAPPKSEAAGGGGGVVGGVSSSDPSSTDKAKLDIFEIACESLQAAPCQLAIEAFRAAHSSRFTALSWSSYLERLRAGALHVTSGDHVSALHHEFASMVGEHLQAALAPLGVSWPSLIRACERAVLDGRCGAERLKLLRPLVAVDDLAGFWDLMASAPTSDVAAAALEAAVTAASSQLSSQLEAQLRGMEAAHDLEDLAERAERLSESLSSAKRAMATTVSELGAAAGAEATETAAAGGVLSVTTPDDGLEQQPVGASAKPGQSPVKPASSGTAPQQPFMPRISRQLSGKGTDGRAPLSRAGSQKWTAAGGAQGGGSMMAAARAAAASARSRAAAAGTFPSTSPLKMAPTVLAPTAAPNEVAELAAAAMPAAVGKQPARPAEIRDAATKMAELVDAEMRATFELCVVATNKPLICREGCELSSARCGELEPETRVFVLERRTQPDGSERAWVQKEVGDEPFGWLTSHKEGLTSLAPVATLGKAPIKAPAAGGAPSGGAPTGASSPPRPSEMPAASFSVAPASGATLPWSLAPSQLGAAANDAVAAQMAPALRHKPPSNRNLLKQGSHSQVSISPPLPSRQSSNKRLDGGAALDASYAGTMLAGAAPGDGTLAGGPPHRRPCSPLFSTPQPLCSPAPCSARHPFGLLRSPPMASPPMASPPMASAPQAPCSRVHFSLARGSMGAAAPSTRSARPRARRAAAPRCAAGTRSSMPLASRRGSRVPARRRWSAALGAL